MHPSLRPGKTGQGKHEAKPRQTASQATHGVELQRAGLGFNLPGEQEEQNNVDP